MYKKATVILLILICISTLFLPACHKETEAGTLVAHLDASALSWEAFSGASAYSVRCAIEDGSSFTFKTNTLSYTIRHSLAGDYLYTVKALGASGRVLAVSEPMLYHLGKGGPTDPIAVSSTEELLAIEGSKTVLFGSNKITVPLYYRLETDLDLSGIEVTPIGKYKTPFRGVFDGNGHTIRGLSFTKCPQTDGAGTDTGCIGLFGWIKNATVKNLTLESPSVILDKDSGVKGGGLRFGCLIGSAESSFIDNCHVIGGKVDILSKVITSGSYTLSTGGIVGFITSGKISGCSFTGDVTAQYCTAYVGGIAGECKGSEPDFVMTNCRAEAEVYAFRTGTGAVYARAGILAGNVPYAGMLDTLLAVGTAFAASKADGTSTEDPNNSYGVFGRTKTGSASKNMTPIYRVYYLDTVPLSGTVKSYDADTEKELHALESAQLQAKETYLVGEAEYAFDFERIWSITEGEYPTLRKTSLLAVPPALEVEVISEEQEIDYTFSLEESAAPSYYFFDLNGQEGYELGFDLFALLKSMEVNVNTVVGSRVRISAEGQDDVLVTIRNSGQAFYLVYGTLSAPLETYGGYKLVDYAALETYEAYTSVKRITVTILKTENAED